MLLLFLTSIFIVVTGAALDRVSVCVWMSGAETKTSYEWMYIS
jgi:hypothetical protein